MLANKDIAFKKLTLDYISPLTETLIAHGNNTYKLFGYDFITGEEYYTPQGVKNARWDPDSFTTADVILDPYGILICRARGISADKRAIEFIENLVPDPLVPGQFILDRDFPFIEKAKIENVWNCDVKILNVESGLSVNPLPSASNVIQMTPQLNIYCETDYIFDSVMQYSCVYTIPRLHGNNFLYMQSLRPKYALDGSISGTYLNFVLTNSIQFQDIGSSGINLANFIQVGGPGEARFLPWENADGTIEWYLDDEQGWQPTGVNALNIEYFGNVFLNGLEIWGVEYEVDTDPTSLTYRQVRYGYPKLLPIWQFTNSYFDPLNSNSSPTEIIAPIEGSLLVVDSFYGDTMEAITKGSGFTNPSQLPTIDGHLVMNYENASSGSINIFNDNELKYYDPNFIINLGKKMPLDKGLSFNTGTGQKNLIPTKYGNIISATENGQFVTDIRPNPLFRNGVLGEGFTDGVNPAIFWRWSEDPDNGSDYTLSQFLMISSALLRPMVYIAPSYRESSSFGLNQIPWIGGILNFLTFGFFNNHWREQTDALGYNSQPISGLMDREFFKFFQLAFYNQPNATSKNANQGICPIFFFDNSNSFPVPIPGQETFTFGLCGYLSDRVITRPRDRDNNLMPNETVDTGYIGQTIFDPETKRLNKFYSMNKSTIPINPNLLTRKNNKLKTANIQTNWIITSFCHKVFSICDYRLTFFDVNISNKDYPNQDNVVWEGKFKTYAEYKKNLKEFQNILILMSYQNTNSQRQLQFPLPLIQGDPTNNPKLIVPWTLNQFSTRIGTGDIIFQLDINADTEWTKSAHTGTFNHNFDESTNIFAQTCSFVIDTAQYNKINLGNINIGFNSIFGRRLAGNQNSPFQVWLNDSFKLTGNDTTGSSNLLLDEIPDTDPDFHTDLLNHNWQDAITKIFNFIKKKPSSADYSRWTLNTYLWQKYLTPFMWSGNNWAYDGGTRLAFSGTDNNVVELYANDSAVLYTWYYGDKFDSVIYSGLTHSFQIIYALDKGFTIGTNKQYQVICYTVVSPAMNQNREEIHTYVKSNFSQGQIDKYHGIQFCSEMFDVNLRHVDYPQIEMINTLPNIEITVN